VECHPGELVAGATCARCGHLLNAVPSPDGRSVRVRCVFLESDPVTTVMTRAGDVVSADADDPLSVAAARMLHRQVDHILVTREGAAIGLLSADAVTVPAGEDDGRVADRMVPLRVVPRTMTLGALTRGLTAGEVTCAAVVEGDDLLGLVTRADLVRSGVPEP
jgi:CBS domain-containing protein